MPEKLDQSELDSIRRYLHNEDCWAPQWFCNDVEALLDEHAEMKAERAAQSESPQPQYATMARMQNGFRNVDDEIKALSERIENIAKAIGGVPRYDAVCELVGRVERLETLPGRLKDDVESLSASIALLEDDGNAEWRKCMSENLESLCTRVSLLESDGNAAEVARRVESLENTAKLQANAFGTIRKAVETMVESHNIIHSERAADKQELANIRTWFDDIMETCKKLARDYKDVQSAARVVRGLAELDKNYPPKTCSACRGNKGWWDETGTKWCGCETCGATGVV